MRGRFQWFFVTAALSLLFHVALVWLAPRAIMGVVLWRFEGRFGLNQLVHAPLADESQREVVRPSPDLAYSFCVLDLSSGPVHIRVPAGPSYTSIALYSSTTDNYFVRNDREATGEAIDVLVLPPGASAAGASQSGTPIVVAPTSRGIALVRMLVESRGALAQVEALRRQGSCTR